MYHCLKYAILVGILATSSALMAQQTDLKQLDLELAQRVNALRDADPQLRYDSLAPKFKLSMNEVLMDPRTLDFAFDSLSQVISIVTSSDGRVRIYSWDEASGGSWHTMASLLQFRKMKGDIDTKVIDMGSNDFSSEYADASIYKIHDLPTEGRPYYLAFGWGTHGGGHHYVLARVFNVSDEGLELCTTCFRGQSEWVVTAQRVDTLDLEYDPKTQTLTHSEFLYIGDTNVWKSTGKAVTLTWKDGAFK